MVPPRRERRLRQIKPPRSDLVCALSLIKRIGLPFSCTGLKHR
jgi:hypothetical protein